MLCGRDERREMHTLPVAACCCRYDVRYQSTGWHDRENVNPVDAQKPTIFILGDCQHHGANKPSIISSLHVHALCK